MWSLVQVALLASMVQAAPPTGEVRPPGRADCGPNYLLPEDRARLGSHSFMILGRDGPEHVIAAHRSGTPPHNFQFLWRLRLDPDELRQVDALFARSETLPALTTIAYAADGSQQSRTFFCLQDLPGFVGPTPDPSFAGMFPIGAAFLENAQHEAIFRIGSTALKGVPLVLERADIELIAHRYLPTYLPPDALRAAVAAQPALRDRLDHGALHPAEDPATAATHASYAASAPFRDTADQSCPRNFKLPKTPVARTPHTFLLFAEQATAEGGGSVLAVHLYDRAPHNHQTALRLRLDAAQLAAVQAARRAGALLMLQTAQATPEGPPTSAFCMSTLREQLAAGQSPIRGTLYAGGSLAPYDRGTAQGSLSLDASAVTVLVNRELASLLDPHEVLGTAP